MRAMDIRTLYDYGYWATDRVLEATLTVSVEQFVAPAPIPFPFGSLRGTLAHMLDTERNARVRLQGGERPPTLLEEEFATPAELGAAWSAEERLMRAFLAGLSDADLDRPFDLGPRGALPVWELLVHFANHATQHRTEAAVLLTLYGHSPGDLDYFLYAVTRAGAESES